MDISVPKRKIEIQFERKKNNFTRDFRWLDAWYGIYKGLFFLSFRADQKAKIRWCERSVRWRKVGSFCDIWVCLQRFLLSWNDYDTFLNITDILGIRNFFYGQRLCVSHYYRPGNIESFYSSWKKKQRRAGDLSGKWSNAGEMSCGIK